jgi:hypothetical protein
MGKEGLIQSNLLRGNASEAQRDLDGRSAVMRQLEVESQTKMAVIVEGPPVYLWPPSGPAFDSMQWRSKSFRSGWNFVNVFAGRIPERKLFQYVLIDDLNYLPKNAENSDIRKQIARLRDSSPEIQQSALFRPTGEQVKVILESKLGSDKYTLHCSRLDAAFNLDKIIDQVGVGGSPLLFAGNANRLMLVVVNPETVEVSSEQSNMLMELYRLLRKHPEFQKYSKKWSSEAITDTFRHVWVDSHGNVKGLTKPEFHGSHFSFIQEQLNT